MLRLLLQHLAGDKMRLIAITTNINILDEEHLIMAALDCGVDYVHLRKPQLSRGEMGNLISKIDISYYSRLVLHDHYTLAMELSLGGIHLNNRNPKPPVGYSGRISRSCHTIGELAANSHLDYCTLSPIFDSISKDGYMAAFLPEELHQARNSGIIGAKTIALGGVDPHNIERVRELGFGGAAVLGYVWGGEKDSDCRVEIDNYSELREEGKRADNYPERGDGCYITIEEVKRRVAKLKVKI